MKMKIGTKLHNSWILQDM